MRHEIIGKDSRFTYHNSVRKGEFLSFINSEWTFGAGPGVSFEHPRESATVS